EQVVAVVGDRGVVLRLEPLDELRDLGRLLDLAVDQRVGAVGRLAQLKRGQVEPADLRQRVDQGQRGGRVGGVGEVVRHLDDEADRVPAGLAEPELEQRRGRAGDLQLRRQRYLAG